MQPPTRLALHEARLVALRERLVRTLGIHTARVLLDRALWQTAQHHPDLALIQHDDGGVARQLETGRVRYEEAPRHLPLVSPRHEGAGCCVPRGARS